MKRLLLILLLTNHGIYSQIGCLAKSMDLKEPFDHKNFHLVACTCDCDYHMAKGLYSPARNQCLQCYHSHDPRPVILVTKIVKMTQEYPSFSSENVPQALQRLINRYRSQKAARIFDK